MIEPRKVLVTPRAVYDEFVGGSGFTKWSPGFWDALLHPLHLNFIEKDKAESDERYLQIVPYVVISPGEAAGSRLVWCYERSPEGDEARLHGAGSIGFGGHIEPSDGSPISPGTLILSAAQRELWEEVDIRLRHFDFLGLVFDPDTPVGRVHLGIVLECQTTIPLLDNIGDEIIHPAILMIREMDSTKFEPWSRMVIEGYYRKPIQYRKPAPARV